MTSGSFAHIEGRHPRTGLAPGYLDHDNETIMFIELIPPVPGCVADALF